MSHDDLVNRLRRDVQWIPGKHYVEQLEEIMDEGADAIERLSAEKEATEKLAREYADSCINWRSANDKLRARIAELESGQPVEVRGEMWQLVPKEPTEKMITAGDAEYFKGCMDPTVHTWDAMLTASAQEAKT